MATQKAVQTKRLVPNLAPLASTSQKLPPTSTTNPHTTLDSQMMHAQIRINANVMKEVDALRVEKTQLLADFDKVAKEKEFFKMKLAHASEQLSYLKKKMVKNSDKNCDPKLAKIRAAFGSKPLRERDNFRDSSMYAMGRNTGSKTLDMPLTDGIGEPNAHETGKDDANEISLGDANGTDKQQSSNN